MKKKIILGGLVVLFVLLVFVVTDVFFSSSIVSPPRSLLTGVAYCIGDWFEVNLRDPGSVEIVDKGEIVKIDGDRKTFYVQEVFYRSKNLYGGYVLFDDVFLIEYTGKKYEVTAYLDIDSWLELIEELENK